MWYQVVLDAMRVALMLMAAATLAITPTLLRRSADDGQRGRFWGSTALLVAVIVANIQNFGGPMRWSFPVVVVGIVSITYGSFYMLRDLRKDRRDDS